MIIRLFHFWLSGDLKYVERISEPEEFGHLKSRLHGRIVVSLVKWEEPSGKFFLIGERVRIGHRRNRVKAPHHEPSLWVPHFVDQQSTQLSAFSSVPQGTSYTYQRWFREKRLMIEVRLCYCPRQDASRIIGRCGWYWGNCQRWSSFRARTCTHRNISVLVIVHSREMWYPRTGIHRWEVKRSYEVSTQ